MAVCVKAEVTEYEAEAGCGKDMRDENEPIKSFSEMGQEVDVMTSYEEGIPVHVRKQGLASHQVSCFTAVRYLSHSINI